MGKGKRKKTTLQKIQQGTLAKSRTNMKEHM